MKLQTTRDQEKLRAVWWAIERHPVRCARVLFPRRRRYYVRAARDVANYASNRAAYLDCKARGDKQGAYAYAHAMHLCTNHPDTMILVAQVLADPFPDLADLA